eukprot:TRINITY_DN1333_c0_g2_i13.p1 TRINITY_DN1333_c0_g2~~TRINITY_DN1333_c0_g2_i13.p1  ORF type:complete len:290 (-),score=82.94 TRINITY_DN1333_c0_g2_i13:506-1375(-)
MSLLSLLGSYGGSGGDDSSPIVSSSKDNDHDVIEIIDENSNNGSTITKSFSIVDYDHGDEDEVDSDRETHNGDNNNSSNSNNNNIINNTTTKVKIFSPTSSQSTNTTPTNSNNNGNLPTNTFPFVFPKSKSSVAFSLLPPPSETEPSVELQDKLSNFFEKKRKGASINQSIRLERTFRNPNILGEILKFYGIDDRSSCYPKEVFDPDHYDKEDYYDSIAETQKILENRRDSKRIDFTEPSSKTGQQVAKTTTATSNTSPNRNTDSGTGAVSFVEGLVARKTGGCCVLSI